MTKLRTLVLPILAGIALSLGSFAQAGTTLYDNLSAASTNTDPILTATPGGAGFGPLADSFSTGSTAVYLTDVKFLLDDTPGNTGTTTVQLLNDSSTTPGSVIGTLGSILDTSLGSSLGIVDVTGFAPVALSANTRYWIELSSTDSSASWSWSTDVSGTGVGLEWYANANGVFPNNPDGPYQMQVNVVSSIIPEPSSLTLGILGIVTLVALRRRVVVR